MNKRKNLFVWIDLEMTGLNIAVDTVLEAAVILTDSALNVIEMGPHLVINHPESVLAGMDEWCTTQHTKSGLVERVCSSVITMAQAEEELVKFLDTYCEPRSGLLAGNSVWQDRVFLQKYMPRVLHYLHYKIIDVTTVQQLIRFWQPNNPDAAFTKTDTHRALTDIEESIAELRHYKKHFFDVL